MEGAWTCTVTVRRNEHQRRRRVHGRIYAPVGWPLCLPIGVRVGPTGDLVLAVLEPLTRVVPPPARPGPGAPRRRRRRPRRGRPREGAAPCGGPRRRRRRDGELLRLVVVPVPSRWREQHEDDAEEEDEEQRRRRGARSCGALSSCHEQQPRRRLQWLEQEPRPTPMGRPREHRTAGRRGCVGESSSQAKQAACVCGCGCVSSFTSLHSGVIFVSCDTGRERLEEAIGLELYVEGMTTLSLFTLQTGTGPLSFRRGFCRWKMRGNHVLCKCACCCWREDAGGHGHSLKYSSWGLI